MLYEYWYLFYSYCNSHYAVEKWFDTSNHDENKRPLPIGKNNKVIGWLKDELRGKIVVEFCVLRPKTLIFNKWL